MKATSLSCTPVMHPYYACHRDIRLQPSSEVGEMGGLGKVDIL